MHTGAASAQSISGVVGLARFVVQEHARDGHRTHWDLMLESGDVLWTFRLELPPGQAASESSRAVRIFDHPLKFLAYEGTVNEGHGRVGPVDSGTYRLIEEGPGLLRMSFSGRVLNGQFVLVRIKDDNWQFGPATTK